MESLIDLLRVADILDPPRTELLDWWKPNPDPTVTDPAQWVVDQRTGEYMRDPETGLPYIKLRARPKQRPPEGAWFAWLRLAGRGEGKTRSGIEWLDQRARRKLPGEQVLLAGRTPSDVHDYELTGPGGLLTHHSDIKLVARRLYWPNGVIGLIRSGANPEEFRGFSGDTALLGEFAAWDYPRECWENLIFGMREKSPRIGIMTTPREKKILKEIIAMPSVITVRGSSKDNRGNLSEEWYRNVIDPLDGTRLGRREIEAEMLEDVEGALWNLSQIDDLRCKFGEPLPEMKRIVVGVDPQGSKKEGSETGIVVAGLGINGHVYVLEDGSLNGTPAEWGTRAVALYEKHMADRIVGERNFGGEMVEHVVRTVRKDVSFELVNASRGKQRRAEPIAAIYEQFRAHHVTTFAALEDEMCSWTPDSDKSPNRMDALVWAVTELVPAEQQKPKPRGGVWGR